MRPILLRTTARVFRAIKQSGDESPHSKDFQERHDLEREPARPLAASTRHQSLWRFSIIPKNPGATFGHGLDTGLDEQIEEKADAPAFVFDRLGLPIISSR